MPTVTELHGLIADNTIRLNNCREEKKRIGDDIDFPHTNKKLLAAAQGELSQLQSAVKSCELRIASFQRRLNTEGLADRLLVVCEEEEGLLSRRCELMLALEAAKEAQGIAPVMSKLEKAMEELKLLPQEQLQQVIASLLANKNIVGLGADVDVG